MTIWKDVLDALPKLFSTKDANQATAPDPPEGTSGLSHLQRARESLREWLEDPKVKEVLDALPKWFSPKEPAETAAAGPVETASGSPVELARESLRGLLDDAEIPGAVRKALAKDFAEVQAMLEKLEHGHLHIAVFGRVSVGKSALVNALLGEKRFSTSPLHGETTEAQSAAWMAWDAGGVFLIDTPGINEIKGEVRERLAHTVVSRSDLVLFVVDGDISATEMSALRQIVEENRPVIVVLNKADRYTQADRALLLQSLKERTQGLIPEDRIVIAAADPAERIYVQMDGSGQELETTQRPPSQTEQLRETLWTLLEAEGKVLSALNATLFAGRLSDAINQRVIAMKEDLANALIRNYCMAKGILVGVNPVPISDLVAAPAVDIGLVFHLSRVYGLPVTRTEAGRLITTIGAQMALVMGTAWTVHVFSSLLKIGTAGLSTLLTAATQGAVAYYSTYIVGQAAQQYFALGRSWGTEGAQAHRAGYPGRPGSRLAPRRGTRADLGALAGRVTSRLDPNLRNNAVKASTDPSSTSVHQTAIVQLR
jgi:GTP-binding protein Era